MYISFSEDFLMELFPKDRKKEIASSLLLWRKKICESKFYIFKYNTKVLKSTSTRISPGNLKKKVFYILFLNVGYNYSC